MQYDIVAEGRGFTEGPVAMPDGSVIFCEITPGRITRAWGDGRLEVIREIPGGPNGAQLGPGGALYICNNGGLDPARRRHAEGPGTEGRIERLDLATGTLERLYDRCGDHTLSAPNDLVFDRAGNLWFTDYGKRRARAVDIAGLYCCRPDGSAITEQYFGGANYNGIALSADETTLYAVETWTTRVWAFEIETPGTLAQIPPRLIGTVQGQCGLDSAALLRNGSLCIATLLTGGITTLNPDGTHHFTAFPDPMVTNIAFGGADMHTAYITLGRTGRVLRTRWPEPGLRLNF